MAVKKTATSEDQATDKEVVSRVYEVGYHLMPTAQEGELEGIVGGIRSVIEKGGGSFIAEGAPVLMKLAYPVIKRESEKHIEYDRGYFGWIKFEAPLEVARTLDETLKHDASILRFIIFRTVREDTRARIKLPTLREVKRTDTIKVSPRRVEEVAAPISEAELDKALEVLTTD